MMNGEQNRDCCRGRPCLPNASFSTRVAFLFTLALRMRADGGSHAMCILHPIDARIRAGATDGRVSLRAGQYADVRCPGQARARAFATRAGGWNESRKPRGQVRDGGIKKGGRSRRVGVKCLPFQSQACGSGIGSSARIGGRRGSTVAGWSEPGMKAYSPGSLSKLPAALCTAMPPSITPV